MKQIALAVSLAMSLCASIPTAAQSPTPPPAEPPEWWASHVEYVSAGAGNWVTPNPPGLDDPDTPDAYAMTWRTENDGHSLVGRLYGLENGAETPDFWTFREFWHPGERRIILQQWGGGGVYGAGVSTSSAPGLVETDQTFWLPDGRSWREGHRTIEGDKEYVTEAFDIAPDGSWTPNSKFAWRRVTSGE